MSLGPAATEHSPDVLEGPARDDLQLVAVLQALADPVRLQLVRVLAQAGSEMSCTDIQHGLPISKSTGSHHFKVLREAGITCTRVDGTRRFNSLRRADLEVRFPGLLDSILNADD
jgi:DNA-binding transcriptional ArsR family regulator